MNKLRIIYHEDKEWVERAAYDELQAKLDKAVVQLKECEIVLERAGHGFDLQMLEERVRTTLTELQPDNAGGES